jgi:hypothetical protein
MKSICFIFLFAILASTATLAQTNPVPLINQPLVPDAVAPGGQGFTLTVNGTDFVSGSVVNWNGGSLATTFVTSSQLTASVPASDITEASTASVTVFSPGPGGGMSNMAFLSITAHNSFVSLSGSSLTIPAGPWGVATADFNGDGKLDLAVPNESLDNVFILLGNGDGTFQSPVEYATGNGPQFLVIGDFNSDGNLDLAICNVFDGTVSILLGNGDGTFQGHLDYPAGRTADVVTAADVNGDGKLDLVVTNFADSTVSVLIGNGDGTFQAPVAYATGANPNWTAVGDFNRDGKLDLAASNSTDNTVSILLGNGNGTFQARVDHTVGQGPACVVAADFNGDGKLDLAIADNIATGQVNILLGNGDGTFQQAVNYAAGNGAINLTAADLNGDGRLDLVVANSGDNTVSVLLGNGNGTFQQQTQYATGVQPRQVAAGDLNGDGRLDLAVANTAGNNGASVLLQDETLTVWPPQLNFGVQVVGTRSTAQKISMTNVGTSTVTLSIAITGPDSTDFGEKNNCGKSLAAGASCAIGVAFQPTQVGPRSASVTITDNAPGSPQIVPLSGVGVLSGPNATLLPTSLTFATQLVGTTGPSQPVTLTNWGTQTLQITGGSISSDFGQTDNCSSNLAPGASCTINVTFTPRQRGTRNGTLSIKDNAPNNPQMVSLTGTGTVVELNPGSLDFGTVIVGQSSQPQTTRLTNVGSAALQITNIGITGDSNDFSQNNTCDGGVGAGQSCTITVTFTPTQAGPRSGDVSVSDNGGGSPQQVGLSGTGQPILQCGSKCSPIHNECPQTCHFCRFDFMLGDICSKSPGPTSPLLNESFLERNQAVSVACVN